MEHLMMMMMMMMLLLLVVVVMMLVVSHPVDPTATSESLPCLELQVPWSNGGRVSSM